MGTALTEQQLFLLKRFTKRLVLALDADAAGEQATLRGLEVARQAMDHSQELFFDSHGLLRFEARLQADIRVATLPPGLDPDEVVQKDPQQWQQLIATAQPIVVHVMETLAAQRDVNDPKQKSEIASHVLPLIREVSNPLERDTYLQRLARLLRVDERSLMSSLAATRKVAQQPKKEKRDDCLITDSAGYALAGSEFAQPGTTYPWVVIALSRPTLPPRPCLTGRRTGTSVAKRFLLC